MIYYYDLCSTNSKFISLLLSLLNYQAKRLNIQIDTLIDELVEDSLNKILKRCGLFKILESLDSEPKDVPFSTTEIGNADRLAVRIL